MSDQNKIANYVESLEDAITMLKRNLASWNSFANKNSALPIVTYQASVNGVKAMDAVSDLSRLDPKDAEVLGEILATHHGGEVLASLDAISTLSSSFSTHLTEGDEGEVEEAPYPEADDDTPDEFE